MKQLVEKSGISDFIWNFHLNKKLSTLATKEESKDEQDKILKLQTHHLSYILGNNLSGNDGFQNMFVSQPKIDTLKLKKDKGTDYVLSWKSKGTLLNLNHYMLHSCIK